MLMLGLVAAPDFVTAADAPVGDQAPMQAPPDLSISPVSTIASARTRFLSLGVGKSVVIDLPREVKDVLVADPKIANAVIRSAQRAYIIGGQVGQTNVVFFTADGQQVAAYDIAVKRDLNGMRERGGRTLPFVFKSEDAAVVTIARTVQPGSTVHADEAAHWDALHARFLTKRINHSEAYSDGEACTNQAESFFSRLRRAEIGIHHHIAGPYLAAYAKEMAWRENNRRVSNGEQYLMATGAALQHPVSRQWKGYWQRASSQRTS